MIFSWARTVFYFLFFNIVLKIRPKKLIVLNYHGVSSIAIRKHLLFLSSYYRFIDTAEFDLLFQRKKELKKNCMLLTFDDGYNSFYSEVYPILKELNIPAVVFIPTAFIGTQKLIWTDYLKTAILESSKESVMINGEKFDLKDEKMRKDVYRYFSSACKKMDHINRQAVVTDLIQASSSDKQKEKPYHMLSWDQVVEMSRTIVKFGAHTHTHPILSTIESDQVVDELSVPKQLIDNKVGTHVNLFAYPNGKKHDYNDYVLTCLKNFGYKYAFTTQQGKVELGVNPYEIKRILLFEKHGLLEIALKVLCK